MITFAGTGIPDSDSRFQAGALVGTLAVATEPSRLD
jgi:hypothetical protein